MPAFKPALFQGFGIDMIDTFMISNCELPQTLPLSVILYRTQMMHGLMMTSTANNHSFSINTTDQADIVAPIRTLYIKSQQSIGIKQLNTLLSDLDSVEKLTLIDFNLNDIDDYAFETLDQQSSMINEFRSKNQFMKRRRYKRNEASEEVENKFDSSTTIDSIIEVNTLLPQTSQPTESSLKIKPKNLDLDSNETLMMDTTKVSSITTTTPAVAQYFPISLMPNEMTNEVSNQSEFESSAPIKSTTTASPMTVTIPIDENNLSDNSSATTIVPDETETKLNYGEALSNTVDHENQPSLMLEDNVISLARILPNLKILQLRNFLKESKIPNVLFQIIKGLEKLEYLELNSNKLDQIPANAFNSARSLQKLYLNRNEIEKIHPDAFDGLNALLSLDLSSNQLSNLDTVTFRPLRNLQYLTLKSNQLRYLNESLFQTNERLSTLDLSRNNQLKPLASMLFEHQVNSLSNLSLAFCNLSQISSNDRKFFHSLTNLVEFDFKGNKLSNLTTDGLFAWNRRLKRLDFSQNKIKQIDSNIFTTNSSQIVDVSLDRNRLENLPENLFQNARNIRRLNLSYNRLQQTHPITFVLLRQLEELDLSHNQIKTLNTRNNQLPFGIGGLLRKIDLSHNNLSDFDQEINEINWRLYVSIAELDLKHNNFAGTLSMPLFVASKEETFKLDISHNKFNSVDVTNILQYDRFRDGSPSSVSGHQSSMYTLVRMDFNPLVCDCFLFDFLNYTRTSVRNYRKNFHDIMIRRTIFIIDQVACHAPDSFRNHSLISINLDELICPIETKDQSLCPVECDCFFRSFDRSLIINCDKRSLAELPEQIKLQNFHNISSKGQNMFDFDYMIYRFRYNQIKAINNLTSLISWPKEIENLRPKYVDLYLDHNNITHLSEDLIPERNSSMDSLLVPLRRFSIKNNQIEQVPLRLLKNFDALSDTNESLLETISIQSKISLGNNPFDCRNDPAPPGSQCEIRDFKSWLSSHSNLVDDIDMIRCDDRKINMTRFNQSALDLILVNISDDILCPILIKSTSNTTLMALSIICIVLATSLFIVSVLYYRNKQTIMAFIYIHLNPIFICFSFTEDDLDEEKIYDAFVSYSSSDRDIVMELIEKLEKPQDMQELNLILQNSLSIHDSKVDQIVPENIFKKSSTLKSNFSDFDKSETNTTDSYRLCIHERDWLPGNLISWNIVNSVQNSKRTILILSENFIKSIWFQVEFHTAYYQMLEDKIDRLIVIVRGELPPKDELDKDLSFLLTTKTYLVWGEKWFWEKLHYAMPHKKQQPKRLDKLQTEKEKLSHSIIQSPKYGIDLMNGHQNESSKTNRLLTKWSNQSKSKSINRTEAMKDYVDQTIASHFQLNTYTPPSSNDVSFNHFDSKSKFSERIQSDSNRNSLEKPAPKSLRNSGTLATATPNVLKELNSVGFVNQSFVDETNT
ncbi:Protein toll [Sarcoptes scabiei]|uniref:Protein toll n=1 Tax=Sarcoptes scabiei TaxID=52283 RepID=A0A834VCH2_SARSC|nr:Protein toll [Sarcoptes scabiei]